MFNSFAREEGKEKFFKRWRFSESILDFIYANLARQLHFPSFEALDSAQKSRPRKES